MTWLFSNYLQTALGHQVLDSFNIKKYILNAIVVATFQRLIRIGLPPKNITKLYNISDQNWTEKLFEDIRNTDK